MTLLRKRKKGSIQDLIFFGVVMVVVAIVALLMFRFSSDFNTRIQGMADIPANGKTASNTITNHYTGVMDNSFLFIAVMIGISALILAALVRVSPIFIPFFFIAWLFVVFLCGIFSNMYQEMASNAQLIAYANQLVIISTVLTYLPLIVGAFGTLLMIVMYKSWKAAQ